MIFSIFDNFSKENLIPNGFSMSLTEYDRHRFRTSGSYNFSFKIDYMGYDAQDIVPIHRKTFESNIEFFKEQGEVIYFIHLNRRPEDYRDLFDIGMNSWWHAIDPAIISLAREGHIKIVLSILVETSELKYYSAILHSARMFWGDLKHFEIWSCFLPPKPSVYYSSFEKNSTQIIDQKHADFEFRHNQFYENFSVDYSKCLVEIPYWEYYTTKIYKVKNLEMPKTKKYISLCRRHTFERMLTHCYLLSHDLIDDGFNSIPNRCTMKDSSLKELVLDLAPERKTFFEREIATSLKYWENHDQGIVLDHPPLRDEDRTMYSANYLGFSSPPDLEPYYAQSYISLVQEGENTPMTYMLTEKIFRTIMYKHMFVMIGTAGLLLALKDRGYMTFDSLWDESYDKIIDDNKRWRTALDLFEDIIKNRDLADLQERAKPILEHNYRHMMSRLEAWKRKYK